MLLWQEIAFGAIVIEVACLCLACSYQRDLVSWSYSTVPIAPLISLILLPNLLLTVSDQTQKFWHSKVTQFVSDGWSGHPVNICYTVLVIRRSRETRFPIHPVLHHTIIPSSLAHIPVTALSGPPITLDPLIDTINPRRYKIWSAQMGIEHCRATNRWS